MDKYIKFIETIKDSKNHILWNKDSEYKVLKEQETCYILEIIEGINIGIGKECESIKYITYMRE